MIKKFLTLILCGIMLLCFVACDKNDSDNTTSTESSSHNGTNIPTNAIFNTENIKRITFYAYCGQGIGSDVPSEHIAEITNWLDSFTIEKEVADLLPPGTNTIFVEIEYLDGSVIKQGMDTTTDNGITYYIKGDAAPECYGEILSKTSLE